MTEERSAGVIVFREDGKGSRLYLLLDYGRHWDFPKGHLKPGEDERTAALRELHEETGIRAIELMDGFVREIAYVFRDGRRLIRKTVVFFLGRTRCQTVTLSTEHTGYKWLEAEPALRRLTYPTARELLKRAEAFLRKQ